MSNKNNFKNNIQGFGLVELMVSISIVVLVTSIILAKHDSYNNAVLLRSQAYDIALNMREVQLLAVSAVGQTGDGGNNFRNEMGLYFDKDNPDFYYIYLDKPDGRGVYNSSYDQGEEIGLRGNIDPRFEISGIRLVGDGNNESKEQVANVSIVFKRPNFDARFFKGSSEQNNTAAVEIDLSMKNAPQGSDGAARTMEVSKTGQIIVQPLKSLSQNPPVITDPNPLPEPDPGDPKPPSEGGGGAKPPDEGGGGTKPPDEGGGEIIIDPEPDPIGFPPPGGGRELQ